MKGLKTAAMGVALLPLLHSCIGEGNGQSGFTDYTYPQTAYANTPGGKLTFGSYGDWGLTVDGAWLTPSLTSGKGMAYYTVPLTYKGNATREMRTATLTLKDNEEDAHVTFTVSQYGTRGDGSWGDAPLVKAIKGDDGSEIAIGYDASDRPAAITVAKDGATLRHLTFAWGDSTVAVGGDDSFTAYYQDGYQMPDVACATDTLRGSYSMDGHTKSLAYYMEEHRSNGQVIGQSAYYEGQLASFPTSYTEGGSFIHPANWPDVERKADSLKCYHRLADGTVKAEYMAVAYGPHDNRCQSADANQLLLGAEECNPYLLLGLFRHLRSTSVIASTRSVAGQRTVETTLNADKSVATLTVTEAAGGKVTYTFSY